MCMKKTIHGRILQMEKRTIMQPQKMDSAIYCQPEMHGKLHLV